MSNRDSVTHDILRYVDAGADFYLRVMGQAAHMEIIDNGIYEIMRSRDGINNLASVYNMRLEHLADDVLTQTVQEIRDMKLHTWWPLSGSERLLRAIHGRIPAYSLDDMELYGAMLPAELPKYPPPPAFLNIREAVTLEEFTVWCDLDIVTEHGGTAVFYPPNHLHLLESGKLHAFIGYVEGIPVATSSFLNNVGIASLEFVSTVPAYRRRGIARAMCRHALQEAFRAGASVVSARPFGDGRMLGRSLGFRLVETC